MTVFHIIAIGFLVLVGFGIYLRHRQNVVVAELKQDLAAVKDFVASKIGK